jgi:hypothetical protein
VDSNAVCFSPGALALLAAIGGVLGGTISVLFWGLIKSKDASIKREQDLNADLTEVLRPSLGIANNALDKVRRDPSGRQTR